jgi:hypothetical protein
MHRGTGEVGRWKKPSKTMRRLCEDYAKTMPTTCCLHRAYTLLTRWQQAEWWLAVPRLEGAEAFADRVRHGRTEEADTRVPAWFTNRAQPQTPRMNDSSTTPIFQSPYCTQGQ